MMSTANITTKGYSERSVSSDAQSFYRDYWVKGNEIDPANIRQKKALLAHLFPEGVRNRKIVELGVGGEGGIIHLLKPNNETIGFDASASAIELCHRLGLDVTLANLDSDRLPLKNDSVDHIFAMEVFEHFASPQFVIEEIHRVLASDGTVVISTPNPLDYHWPKLFYPELFSYNAFHDFLTNNGFIIEKVIGYQKTLLQPRQAIDRFWHWVWCCQKMDTNNHQQLLDAGLYFWRQRNAEGFRAKPIEAIDFFRQSHEADTSAFIPRCYLARSLVYRFVVGTLEEFNTHFNYLTQVIQAGPEAYISQALYHFAMIYVELEMLGRQQMSEGTFQTAMERLSRRQDGPPMVERIKRDLAQVQRKMNQLSQNEMPWFQEFKPRQPLTEAFVSPSPETENTRPPLFLGLVKGDNYGWGVCSRYLIECLSRELDVRVLNATDGSSHATSLKGPLFQGLANQDFVPLFPDARGERNYGYTFFENELTDKSVQNAKHFDLVLAGSSWCRDRMLEKGIANCDVLIQGIDPDLFFPLPFKKAGERFVIFSGGKFELRKGQDLVLAALKILQSRYDDIWLVNCWYNLWPASTQLMRYSRHIDFDLREGESWGDTMRRTYLQNGLDADRIITYDLMPHEKLRDLFTETDIGVFPNRCEGGTNLAMMEYMACAKPVIASNTSGHRDILTDRNALCLNNLSDFNVNNASGQLIGRWQEPSLDELVAQIEFAYHHRDAIARIGRTAGEDLKQRTWQHTAQKLRLLMGI